MNDDQLANELRRRAGRADVPDLLPAVRSAIDTRPQPVPTSRWAPLAGLAGVAAVLVILVVALPRLTPGGASPSPTVLDAPPAAANSISVAEFARFQTAGDLSGHTVLVNGAVVYDDALDGLYGNVCSASGFAQREKPNYTCTVGRLAGIDPPIWIDADYVADAPNQEESGAAEVAFVWRALEAPVTGLLVLSVDPIGRVTLLGSAPDEESVLRASGELFSSDPERSPFGTALIVPGWLTGVVDPLPCPPGATDPRFAAFSTQRCPGPSWLMSEPVQIDRFGRGAPSDAVVVQSDAYSAYAPAPSTSGAPAPRVGLYVVASRLDNGGCLDFKLLCRQWQVIGRITLNDTDGPATPIATPVATPDVVPTGLLDALPQILSCPPVRDSLGDISPTLVDETGLVEECLAATPNGGASPRNPGGDLTILEIEWSGSSCDAAARISFTRTTGSYRLDITPRGGLCRLLQASYAVRLALREPISAADVQVTYSGALELGQAWWELAPHERPTAGSTELDLVVHEQACANGESPDGRVVGPRVEYSVEAVTILFWVSTLPGGGDCPLAPGAPVTVQLAEPLGARRIIDGGVARDAVIEASDSLLAIESGRVDELAHERFASMVPENWCTGTAIVDRYVPTQDELEAAAAKLEGDEGFIEWGGYLSDDWLQAARAFGALEAYGGRPKPWYIVTQGDGELRLAALDPFPISGGRTIWFAGFYQSTVAQPECGPLPSQQPDPTPPPTTTISCTGAPASPERGSVSIEDHTGSVVGCTVTDGPNPPAASLTSAGAPPRLTVEWIVPCSNSDPLVSRLELWHREPTGGPTNPSQFQPGYLLMVNRSESDGSYVCRAALSGRTVELQLRDFIFSGDVEMFFTDGAGRGVDTRQGDGSIPNLELSITANRTEYTEGEAIEVSSALLADADVTLACGPTPVIAMEQLDGPLEFYPGPFILLCPPPTEMRSGVPLTSDFAPEGWGYSEPNPLAPYLRDGELYLPPGTYRFFATSSFDVGERPSGERVELEASVVVTVR